MNGLGICIIGIRKISNEDAAGIPLAVMDDSRRNRLLFILGKGFPMGIVVSPCRTSGTGGQKEC